jgi:hypothetical protein
MGLRLQSEFHSSTNKLYKIEIYQEGYSAGITSFTVASDGFTLEYSGETDDIVSPIIGSRCTINAYNEVGAFDSFINKLTNRQEHLFYVKISLYEGTGYKTFWTGIVTQDLVSELDESKPRIFQIVATDGIGLLANKDYETIVNTTVEGFLEEAVGVIGLDEIYAATDTFYATAVNVWDTNQTYSATTDVTTLTRFDARVYSSKDEDGTITYSSYLDILKELCIAFGARFYQKDGVYLFEQYLERTSSSRTVFYYRFDGAFLFSQSESDDVTLDGTTTGGARLSGNSYTYLPAMQKVQVSFNQERANNLLASGMTFTATTGRQNLGFLVKDDNARVEVIGDLLYQLTHNGGGGSVTIGLSWRPVWQIELRIEDVNNPGTYHYLNRSWSPGTAPGANIYGATSWISSTSATNAQGYYYYLDGGSANNEADGVYLAKVVGLVTPPLPVNGTAELDVDFYNVYDNSYNVQTVPSYFTETRTAKNFRALYLNDSGAQSDITIYSSTNSIATVKSNLILDLGELRLGDSTGIQGSLYVYTGSAWVASTQWRRGNSGSYQSLLKLLTSEVLSLHHQPVEIYNGTIVGPFEFGRRYVFDSADWLIMGGTFNANVDEWSAEWFAISSDDSGIAADTPVGTGGGSDFQARVSSQQGTDEIIIADIVNTTQANVEGTLSTNGGVTTAVNAVAATPGGSEEISAANYMNFIGYSGANGTYTLNLPAASDGVLLRFKTDDTVLANKTITLSADGSETIDGESTYVMDRSFDGISLLGFSGNWYIVQKKEK